MNSNKQSNIDSIFSREDDWHNNACLNFSPDMSQGYISGYKVAADKLIADVDENASNQDTLVYPIIFLYRQHIELSLKRIIKNGRFLQGENPSFPIHHDIKDLWDLVKGIIKFVWKNNKTKEIAKITDIIIEFHSVDPDSMSFRYPVDLVGKAYNPEMRYVNLRKFGEIMNFVSQFLCGIDAEIEQHCSYINEKLAEN